MDAAAPDGPAADAAAAAAANGDMAMDAAAPDGAADPAAAAAADFDAAMGGAAPATPPIWLRRAPALPPGATIDKVQLVWNMPGMPGNPNDQTVRRVRQLANHWDRWLKNARRGPPPKQADPRLAAGESHPSAAEDPHYTVAKATARFVRNVPAAPVEKEAEAPSPTRGPAMNPRAKSRGLTARRQRSLQSAHHMGYPATKARPGPPPNNAAWPATAVAGRTASWGAFRAAQPPPAAAAAGGARDRVHTRSPRPQAMPRPRPAAAAPAAAAHGRADGNARRRHVSWSDMHSSDSYYSYSGSDSGPGEPTAGGQRRAYEPAAAAAGWGHRGAHAQVDHDRHAQYESSGSPRGRALVFARYPPMGAAAPYLEVPLAIRHDAATELRGQYIYAQFPIQDSCLFGARPWQILNQHV